MPILTNDMMRMIILDHHSDPKNKHLPLNDKYQMVHHHSSNCIDDINVYVLIENGVIKDCCWDGVACTISTASTDIMCDLAVGKSIDEGFVLIQNFMNMIQEKDYDEDLLEEANAFVNTSKQASRIKCATIGWDALKELLENER